MSDRFFKLVVNPRPLSYEPPPFPSLYWPFPVGGSQAFYLYDFHSMWRFTLLWTLIAVIGVHLVAASYAVLVQWRNWRFIWIAPLVFALLGAIEASIAGNVVGGIIGGIYQAGYFHMSTWLPFSWGVVNALVLIISSFAIQGGM